jgi:hypothetical protein
VIREIDAWIGKTLFHPLIIVVCQMMNWTQYRFAQFTYLFVMMVMFFTSSSWIGYLLFGFQSMMAMMHIVYLPDKSVGESLGGRMFWMGLLIGCSWAYAIGASDALLPLVWLSIGMLTRQYALTIKTIPPREQKFTVKVENR